MILELNTKKDNVKRNTRLTKIYKMMFTKMTCANEMKGEKPEREK